MNITYARAAACCNDLVDAIDSGAGTAVLEIRTSPKPTNADDSATGTILCAINLSNPAFGAASNQSPGARATANGLPLSGTASGTGDAAWFRVYDRDGNDVFDGTVGTGSEDLVLANATINSGNTVTVTAWTVDMPES